MHLKLTGDLTEELSKIVIPEEEQNKIDEAEKEAKEDLLLILNSDFKDLNQQDNTSCEKFKCNVCNFSTNTERNLRMHRKTIHSENKGIYKCDVCKKTLGNKGELLKHTKTKHQTSKCDICHFMARSPSFLKTHMKRKHEKAYQCDECPQSFETKISLDYHKQNHIAAFKCNICDFKGVSKNALRYHTIQKHAKGNSGIKREASIKITKESKKAKDGSSPMKEDITNSKNTLPKKESDVVGGEGWSLKKREYETKIEQAENFEKQVKVQNDKSYTTKKETKEAKLSIHDLKINSSAVPEVCKKHLPDENQDSFVHHVLGDGACCIRCLEAHFGEKGEQVKTYSKDLNNFKFRNNKII